MAFHKASFLLRTKKNCWLKLLLHGNQFHQFVVDNFQEIFKYQFAKGRLRCAVFHWRIYRRFLRRLS